MPSGDVERVSTKLWELHTAHKLMHAQGAPPAFTSVIHVMACFVGSEN
jgi:hypothetical protein